MERFFSKRPSLVLRIIRNSGAKRPDLFYASPLIAGDNLYAPREDGVVFVASIANNKFELLSENDMAEPVIGSPVPSSNRIFLRGEKHLFCIGSPSTKE